MTNQQLVQLIVLLTLMFMTPRFLIQSEGDPEVTFCVLSASAFASATNCQLNRERI